MYQCMQCGHRYSRTKQANRALVSGCVKCGSVELAPDPICPLRMSLRLQELAELNKSNGKDGPENDWDYIRRGG